MAGHSKFKKIKHKKELTDQRRSKEFSKVSNQIIIAVKIGGGDPKDNSRLRAAIASAKQVNFPRSKIDDAIRKGMNPNEGDNLEEVRYEGFGPSGVALLVESVSPSKQLQVDKSVVKKVFTKYGGSLGEGGAVSYLFQKLGLITYPGDVKPEDDMLMLALENGADDCQKVDDEYEILCRFENLHSVRDDLEKSIGEPSNAKSIWKPNNTVMLDHKKTKTVMGLIDELEDLEMVQDVWSNIEIPEDFNVDV